MTEAEIRDAFTPDDYEGAVADLNVTQTPSGAWKVDGEVRDERNNGELIARYTRTLDPVNFTAKHDSLLVEEPHRHHGFSRDLLRKCFPFYRKNGIQFVDLDAADDGIFVWPRRGWSPVGEGLRLVHNAMRVAYLNQYGEPLPLDATLPTFGPAIIEYCTTPTLSCFLCASTLAILRLLRFSSGKRYCYESHAQETLHPAVSAFAADHRRELPA
jgi:GNAT superfamily N-acetyltransferase